MNQRELAARLFVAQAAGHGAEAERLARILRNNYANNPRTVEEVLGAQPGWRHPSTAKHLR